MPPSLVDVNVWLALLIPRHEFHGVSRSWFDGLCADEAGLCRLVQLGVVRLLAQRAVLGRQALSLAAGRDLLARLQEDERIAFLPEPPGLDTVLAGLMRLPQTAPQLVSDLYLLAFADSLGGAVVTLDRRMRQLAQSTGVSAQLLC